MQRNGNLGYVQCRMNQKPLGFKQEPISDDLPRRFPGFEEDAFAQMAGRDLEHPGIGRDRTHLEEMSFQSRSKLVHDGLGPTRRDRRFEMSPLINSRRRH